jgi:hypothetical protein
VINQLGLGFLHGWVECCLPGWVTTSSWKEDVTDGQDITISCFHLLSSMKDA